MMKHCNPTYSPSVVARMSDPWRKILFQYRPAPSWVRRYGGHPPISRACA